MQKFICTDQEKQRYRAARKCCQPGLKPKKVAILSTVAPYTPPLHQAAAVKANIGPSLPRQLHLSPKITQTLKDFF